jgi:predicted dehydrogenase
MRFAILGNHSDGLALASALVATGRHQILVCTAAVPAEEPAQWGADARRVEDLEEVLADPAIEAVIVAGSPVNRPVQLRRALQSERHVLCVHPADQGPDTAYEAAMIQRDTGCVLLPLLPESLHPGLARLAELAASGELGQGRGRAPRLIELERRSPGQVLIGGAAERKPALPGWDVLRRLGGEIAEVTAFAEREALSAERPVFLTGRFERGGLFQASFVPYQSGSRWRLSITGDKGQAELVFPEGWPGPALLTWSDADGEHYEENWESWDPWAPLVEVFEAAVAQRLPSNDSNRQLGSTAVATARNWSVTWQDAVRCLELDDAARRSTERRRASALEYPEATEETGLKGTMTLVGCGLLWLVLLLVILAVWVPWVGWLIGPVLFAFLLLQVFLWVVSRSRER